MTLRKISIFVITLMLICSGTGTLSNVASAADEFEPNDNLDSASDISPGEYTNLELVSDESDYYALSVDQGETVDVTLTVPKQADGGEPENNPTLRLVDSAGNYLDGGERRTSPADETIRYTLQYESQSTQTVYIRVYGIDDREVSTSYDLSIDRGTNDKYEPNGVLGSAPSLTPGTYSNLTLLDDESDHYALSVERGETVDVTLTVPKQADGGDPENNPVLQLVDSNGNYLDGGERRTAPADETIRYTLQYESQATQTVYIRVYGADDREISTSYDLSINRGTNDRYEPNGVLGSASSLNPGTYSNLTLLDDENDYFRVVVGEGKTASITLTVPKQADGEDPENDPVLRLEDSDGNYLDGGERRTAPADETIRYTLQYESQATQTVYIRVYGADDREVSTSYDLSITGTEPFESEPEPSAPPDINETSLSIEPFPVSTGDAPTVSVNATDTTDAFVNVTVDGQQGSVRMQNVNDDRWEADLSELDAPDMDGLERGSKVELSIVACNEACTPETKTVLNRTEQAYQETELPTSYDESKYPSQVSQKRPLHYFVFDTVVDVPVVLVDFAGQDPGEHGFGSEQQVVQWEKAREYDLNSFFGSGRGAMGSIGFNLVYYDNDGSLYRVRDRSQYRYTEIENGKIELKTEPVDFTNDGKAAALPATAERYVVTHPGESFTSAQVTKPSGEETRMYVAMEDDHYGVWVEEFAHLHLRMGDLYAGGDVQGGISTGIMSSGHGIPAGTAADAKLPDSFSVVSRTELNNLGFTTNSDPDWPWIGTDEQLLRSDSTVDTTVERINETEIGDSTTIVNTGENDQPITGTAVTVPVKYVFQLSPEEKTLNAYRFSERRGRLSTLTEVHEVSSGDRSRISDGRFVEFNVEYVGSQGGLEAEVSTEMVPADEESKVISIIPDLITFDSILGERPNTTAPDVDLRAIDSQGRVTGVTEEGEFVNDIPGARASGDRVQGPEWISVPSDADVEFEVSTADAQTFVNETNVSEENATISYTTSVTEVGENPQLVTENGTVTVTNTTTTTTNETAEPGETKQVSTGFSVAQFDRDDDDVIGFDDLRFALREFNNGNITFDQLRRILRAYNTGEPV
jgi:hypothetical protein